MGFKECQFCHQFFPSDLPQDDTCSRCRSEIDRERKTVRAYLEKHQGASIMEINLATKVPIKAIQRLIETGALSFK